MPSIRAGKTADIEEERRLFYVAATRAKDLLIMTYPVGVIDRFTQQYLCELSPFVKEIPKHLIEFVEAKHETMIQTV